MQIKNFTKIFSVIILTLSIFAVDTKPANAEASGAVESVKEFFFGKSTPKNVEPVLTVSLSENKTSCEVFDDITDKVLDLESSSGEMKLKIDKIEDIINQEYLLREEIFGNTKDLILLKTKEKIIFKTMKKQIDDARNYYTDIDTSLASTSLFIDSNICDDEDLPTDEAIKMRGDIDTLKTEETIYKKALVTSLKNKVKTLQDNVKDLKALNK